MTARISRARRAELNRDAHQVRRQGQRAGWLVPRIAAAIQVSLPQILPLEAWRLAYGWTTTSLPWPPAGCARMRPPPWSRRRAGSG
jgi:hypothetical protein